MSKKQREMNTTTGGQKALFLSIWNSRPRISFISGIPLGDEAMPHHFAHVIPKGTYSRFRLYDKNIVLLTPEEHTLYDFGSEEQREQYTRLTGADWNKLYELREELIKEYNSYE